MQPVGQQTLANKFLQAGLENFFDRVWDLLWILGGVFVLAVIGLVVAQYRGYAGRWTYLGIGALVTRVAAIASVLALVMIADPQVAVFASETRSS